MQTWATLFVGATRPLPDAAMDAVMDGLLDNANVRILEVGDRWVTIEYERTKEDAMFQKETVVRKVERAMIIGASFAEEKES